MLVSHRMVSRARRWRFGADWRDCRNGRRLLQTVTCERGRPSRGSLGRVAPVGNHRRSGQALALLLAGPWGSHRTFLGPSFSLRNRCGVTWGCGESFTDGEALRGYCSEGPDTGDLKIFLVWLPCDVQSRICFKISKGQLEQIVKKFLLISTAPRIWRGDGILPVECESVAQHRVCLPAAAPGESQKHPTSPELPSWPQDRAGSSALDTCRLWCLVLEAVRSGVKASPAIRKVICSPGSTFAKLPCCLPSIFSGAGFLESHAKERDFKNRSESL